MSADHIAAREFGGIAEPYDRDDCLQGPRGCAADRVPLPVARPVQVRDRSGWVAVARSAQGGSVLVQRDDLRLDLAEERLVQPDVDNLTQTVALPRQQGQQHPIRGPDRRHGVPERHRRMHRHPARYTI